MDLITGLFNMDFAALVPEMGVLMGIVRVVLSLLLLAGPLAMVILGFLYLFMPPPEANYKFGFRTYFGMGSVEAWRYTQKLAGAVWCLLGLALAVWMAVAGAAMAGMATMDAMLKMAGYIFWQALALLVSRVLINFLVFLRYDRKGVRRYTWAELWRG